MNFKLSLFVILFCLVYSAHSQLLSIKDELTQAPIKQASVLFQNSNKIVTTDEFGQVYLGGTASERMIISHPSYSSVLVFDVSTDTIVYLSEPFLEIDEVVVSASKWEQDRSEVPNEILSISAKQIARNNPQTSADMLGQSGQVFIQKSQMGGGSPMIRGFSANAVLIMMDGIRINNAIYRGGNLQNVIMLDPNLLSESEVIFGPGSSMYGSDALGGVMDFHTLRPSFTDDKSFESHGTGMMRFSLANLERTGHFHLNIQNKKWSNTFGVTFSEYDDLREGSNRTSKFPDYGKRFEYIKRINGQDRIIPNGDVNKQRFSGYHQYNIMNKLSYRLSNESSLTYMLYYTSSSNIPRYDRLIERDDQGVLESAEWYYGPQQFLLNALTFANYSSNAFYDGIKIILSSQHVEESRHDRKYQASSLRSRTEQVGVYALNVDLDKKISSRSELYYGAELLLNGVSSEGQKTDINTHLVSPTSTRYPDGGSVYASAATYANFKTRLNEEVMFTAGLRYTYVHLKSAFDDRSFFDFPYDEIELNNDALSGSLGAVISPVKNLRWNLLFSTGFRSPNVDDVGKVFDSEPGSVVVPNENLSPEYTFNYETGIYWALANRVTLDGTLYYTQWRDALVRSPFTFNGQSTIVYDGVPSDVEALVNVGEAYIWGYSLGLSAKLSRHFVFMSRISNNDGEDQINDTPLRHTNPLFGHVSLSYRSKKLTLEGYTDFQGKRTWNELAPSEQAKAYLYTTDGALAWYTLNIRSAFQVSNELQITAALENILDKHYRPYSSGISAAGINGVISARYTF
ncbi:TonB-dependent receptor [Reichenbachiella carrageenanivorans]|uniref:TonB-dependent receptor n=1 Tax=Reichenbachiella carrageenanivorans TaxID=2979869 RepID=A0ABY6CVN3_9BACT|nr:TonB-dependent receptor [Reichenbachiella carrageenanivorans]UXX77969.1 TonB-dependent receptor [Reichenbachiella carrageenanivorans]